tara:strand:+ start:57 stop:332 length:276 start_codon:yes stop_codon:yes gene_type:complete
MSMDREGEGTEQGEPGLRGNIPTVQSIAKPPNTVSQRKISMSFGKVRPQIFLAVICLSLLAIVGIYKGYSEIATATIGGIIALGMKVLENE